MIAARLNGDMTGYPIAEIARLQGLAPGELLSVRLRTEAQ